MPTPFVPNSGPYATPSRPAIDRLALDNLLRRELKVADPSDPAQVAQALVQRYRDDPRAAAIQQEAQGLPFLATAPAAPVAPSTPTASDAEWQQALDDTDRDLRELTTNALLKDFAPELNGWSQAIRSALSEAVNAARFGLDPRQRDKTFAIRRQLSEYARLARLVGALNPDTNGNYRQLACSLDEVSAVVLVKLGEALANVGFGGRFLLQAPYTELQTRRDAVLYSLRVLVGSTQEAYGPNDWPRGLDAYRRLFQALDDGGLGDLRSLMVETELMRVMDELLQRAGSGNIDGLRAIGATAEVDLVRFRRLVFVGRSLVRPESPPLTAFLQALQLFADGFTTSGGYRLLRIARPPILLYGLYNTQASSADTRLIDLAAARSRLAEQLDCLRECLCCEGTAMQVALDLALYGIDRAIDLYAVGKDEFGQSECRASAYAYVVLAIQDFLIGRLSNQQLKPAEQGCLLRVQSALEEVLENLAPLRRTITTTTSGSTTTTTSTVALLNLSNWEGEDQVFLDNDNATLRENELELLMRTEQHWETTSGALTQACSSDEEIFGPRGLLFQLVNTALLMNSVRFPSTSTLPAPGTVFQMPDDTISIPPQFETLLDGLVNDIDSRGLGRP